MKAMTIRWNETVSLSWAERGKVHGQLMPIGDAVDLFATFSDERKRRSEIFLLEPVEIAPGETILQPEQIEQLLILR
jgi:hypothetical protein